MSHREEPRSGRGCFGAVVVVPFLALGGMFALIALTGGPAEAPRAAPPPSRPSAQWWTEPFETGVSLSTVTETVVAQGAAREVLAARVATQTRVVGGATVTETVRVSAVKPAVTGRNEPEPEPEEEVPAASSEAPVVTTTTTASASAPVVVSSVEPAPPAETPPVEVPPSSTPRAEDPVPPVTTSPVEPPCDRAEPPSDEESGGGVEDTASPAEDVAAPSAGA
ncbi:hypothetical protein [Lentzea sp. NPDC055074]